jgi:hypothetical protein
MISGFAFTRRNRPNKPKKKEEIEYEIRKICPAGFKPELETAGIKALNSGRTKT